MATRSYSGIERREEIPAGSRREDTRTWVQKFHDVHSDPKQVFWWYLRLAAAAAILAPFPFLPEIVLIVAAYFAASNLFYKNKRWEAPFRVPAYLGEKGFRDASSKEKAAKGLGTVFLGTGLGQDEGLEVWATPTDVRTHRLVVGTTGSGKTEELFGEWFNALLVQSGAILVDGKGSQKTHHRLLSICRMFGREQEMFLLTFMMGGQDVVGSNPTKRSNTNNPLATGASPAKAEILKNLLGEQKGGDPSWRQRAENLIDGLIPMLTFLHTRGHILFNAKALVEFLKLETVENLIYFGQLRNVHGEVINLSKAHPQDFALLHRYTAGMIKALTDNLPSYSMARPSRSHPFTEMPTQEIDKALAGGPDAVAAWATKYASSWEMLAAGDRSVETQGALGAARQQAAQQWGFLVMQIFVAASQLSYVYGHIFDDEIGEIDWRDTMLNRRLVYVTLPSMDRSPQSMAVLGRFAVSCIKTAIGRMLETSFEGDSREIVEGQPFNARMPFYILLDEYTHYVVPGFSTVPAQAREFGIAVTFGVQELDGMGKDHPVERSQTFENTNIRLFGRFNGGTHSETWRMMAGAAGEASVMVAKTSFYNKHRVGGAFETGDEVVQETIGRINYNDVQRQESGEFHLSVGVSIRAGRRERGGSRVIRYQAFYTGNVPSVTTWRLNHFVSVLPPTAKEIEERQTQHRIQRAVRTVTTARIAPVALRVAKFQCDLITVDAVATFKAAFAAQKEGSLEQRVRAALQVINKTQSERVAAAIAEPMLQDFDKALEGQLQSAGLAKRDSDHYVGAWKAMLKPSLARMQQGMEKAGMVTPAARKAVEQLLDADKRAA